MTAWGHQDGTMAATGSIACGPHPHGHNPGLLREESDRDTSPDSSARSNATWPAVERTPVPGEFHIANLTLRPPPPGTNPAACVDVAVAAVDPQPTGPGANSPSQAWLAVFSAATPAHINRDASITPDFTDVLAWVFVFTNLSPMMCAGPPGVGGSPGACATMRFGPSTEIATIDATTGETLTCEQISGPPIATSLPSWATAR